MAENKKLSAVLEFKDGFSAVVKKAGSGLKAVGNAAVKGAQEVRGIGSAFAAAGINVDAFNSKVKKMGNNLASSAWDKTKSALKGLAVGAVATGTAMTVMGFKAASSIEQYKNTLDTVLKDPKKASATLEWANKFADETPFQNKEVMDATVKLHAYGLDPQVFLKTIGDTAATMGKSLDQAVEAIADASVGELERMKEFGIKKDQVIAYGKKLGLEDFVDAKGTITDANKFMMALSKLMENRHKDGMEKQSKTVAGLWSTILGKSQSALAKFVGMNRDGSARAGSAFEWFKSKLETVVGKFNELEADGALERWSKKIDEEILPKVSQAFDTVCEWIQNIKKEDLMEWGNGIKSAFEMAAGAMEYLIKNIDKAIIAWGAFKLAALGARAAAGDPVAIAQLAVVTVGAVGYAAANTDAITSEDKWGVARKEIKNYSNNETVRDNSSVTNANKIINNETVREKTKAVTVSVTGPITINNGMDVETLANRIALASMTQY